MEVEFDKTNPLHSPMHQCSDYQTKPNNRANTGILGKPQRCESAKTKPFREMREWVYPAARVLNPHSHPSGTLVADRKSDQRAVHLLSLSERRDN
jgi:hypothetical protein